MSSKDQPRGLHDPDDVRFTERGEVIEIIIEYLLEVVPHRRIFHVLSIKSQGDPPRPMMG